ncbi:MAG: RraA family protein [Aminobacterium colombiense]|jgi:RraA family protein|nr:RraA family protein [Aminobacterium colombiense]MDD4585784.1 RraA family protein [Aminobacterium colombiense]
MSIGFRVFTQRDLPPKDLVEKFKHIPAANIADGMNRSAAMASYIRLMTAPTECNMVGVALTVRARGGDNLMFHKALNMAEEGDVIVLSNEGDRSHALMGEMMALYARHKKVAGIVIEGPVRDVEALYSLGVPVYATGSTPGGPYKDGPGEVNVGISCGGIFVCPGDIIVGDADGVIVVPKGLARQCLEGGRRLLLNEEVKGPRLADGTGDRSWVEKTLDQKGCETIDGIWLP